MTFKVASNPDQSRTDENSVPNMKLQIPTPLLSALTLIFVLLFTLLSGCAAPSGCGFSLHFPALFFHE